jgi:hypothetical protein
MLFLLAVLYELRLAPGLTTLACLAWPLAGAWMEFAPRRPGRAAPSIARPGVMDRFGDAILRLMVRPRRSVAGRPDSRPDPSWLMRIPNMQKSIAVSAMVGAGMGPGLGTTLAGSDAVFSWVGVAAGAWVMAISYSTLPYVAGLERLLLIPGGISRETLPAALRKLLLRAKAPMLAGLLGTGFLWTLLFAHEGGPHPGRPWFALGAAILILAVAWLSTEVLVSHPGIVRRQWIGMVVLLSAWLVFALPISLLAIARAAGGVSAGTFASHDAAALAFEGCAIVYALALGFAARRLGRRAWQRADLALLIAHWRRERERHAELQEQARM